MAGPWTGDLLFLLGECVLYFLILGLVLNLRFTVI